MDCLKMNLSSENKLPRIISLKFIKWMAIDNTMSNNSSNLWFNYIYTTCHDNFLMPIVLNQKKQGNAH